jgi:hypothetical protein
MFRHTLPIRQIFGISFDLDMSRILFVMMRANAPKVQQMDWPRATPRKSWYRPISGLRPGRMSRHGWLLKKWGATE